MAKHESLERMLEAFKDLGLNLLNVGAPVKSPVNDGLNLLSDAVSIAYEIPVSK